MPGELVLVIDDSPTITKAVDLALSKAGYRVTVAEDGERGLLAARAHLPDLVLVDFVMPRMNGYQVCRELAGDPRLSKIPVVLMSAKGDLVGERFVKSMGIVDYLTKPFAASVLVEVTRRALGGERSGSALPGSPELPAARAHQLPPLRGQLEALLVACLEAWAAEGGPPPPPRATAEALAARVLDDRALTELLATFQRADGAGLRGDLGVLSLAEVLPLLDSPRHSGRLTARRGEQRVDIELARGLVTQAYGRGLPDEFRLGRFLLERGELAPADVEAIAAQPAEGVPLGQRLRARGLVPAAELTAALRRQSEELLYEAMRWRAGELSFLPSEPTARATEDPGLKLSIEELIEKGCRRIDEWNLIERAIDHPHAIFARADAAAAAPQVRLLREEEIVLELVDGARSVGDLVGVCHLSSFEIARSLYRLLSLKLIRRVDRDVDRDVDRPAADPPASAE